MSRKTTCRQMRANEIAATAKRIKGIARISFEQFRLVQILSCQSKGLPPEDSVNQPSRVPRSTVTSLRGSVMIRPFGVAVRRSGPASLQCA